MMNETLYDRIGDSFIRKAVTEFYQRAFGDMIIGHFFFGLSHDDLARQQIDFTIALLGGPRSYQGRPLAEAHASHNIRRPHFDRRRTLLREVLDEMGLDPSLTAEWLAREDAFRSLILRS